MDGVRREMRVREMRKRGEGARETRSGEWGDVDRGRGGDFLRRGDGREKKRLIAKPHREASRSIGRRARACASAPRASAASSPRGRSSRTFRKFLVEGGGGREADGERMSGDRLFRVANRRLKRPGGEGDGRRIARRATRDRPENARRRLREART